MNPQDTPKKICTITECTTPRTGRTRFCKKHLSAIQTYSDPQGKSLAPSHYQTIKREVTELIASHRTDKAVIAVLSILSDWLVKAANGVPCPASIELQRLSDHAITPDEILIEALSVYVYSSRNPQELPPDSELLMYQVANAVMRLAPRPRTEKPSIKGYTTRANVTNRKVIGRHLKTLLDPFYVCVTHGAVAPAKTTLRESLVNLIVSLRVRLSNLLSFQESRYV